MAGMKISQLDVLDTLSGDEKLVVAKGGDNYGVTVETLLNQVPQVEDQLSYGIEYDTTVSSPQCTRIGNFNYHRSLPIHSKMKGCLLSDDGTVQKYLDPSTWVNETRDGSQGQVMVEIPSYYRKFETEGTKRRVRISEMALPGYHFVKKKYVSAYEASVQRSTTTLCSVVNDDTDYRGGNNTSDWDGTYRTLLGRPATSINRTNFRAMCKVKAAMKDKEGTRYCLKIDIKKFYPSIDHEILKSIVRKKIKCERTLRLLDEIIDSAPGVPIGNYLSQYLANLYLAYFDHWVKEVKHVKYYFRYADDMVFLASTKEELHSLLIDIREYLSSLKLRLKGNEQVFPIKSSKWSKSGRGLDFVGFVFYHDQTLIRKSIKKNFCKGASRLNRVKGIKVEEYKQGICGWLGWAKYSDSRNLLRTIIKSEFYDKCLLRP